MEDNGLIKNISFKGILLLFSFLLIGLVYVILIRFHAIDHEKQKVLQIAHTVEAILPKAEIQSLPENPDELAGKNFNQLKKILQQVIQVNQKARFAYIYIERNGNLYFVVDSEPESSPDYSPPGQEFTEAKPIDKQPFADGKALVTMPVTDRWGTWVSAEVPLIDPLNGRIIAVLGMDYNAKEWEKQILFETFQSSLLVLIILILILVILRGARKNVLLKREISLREVAEQGLKESESDYRLLFELNPEPMLVYDLESMNILAVNQASIEKYGYTKEEFSAMSIIDLKSTDDFLRLWKNLIADKHSLQRLEIWNHKLKDGRTIQVEVHSHNFDFRHKDARLVLLIDITDSLKTKKALSINERQMISLVENLPGIVYRCAPDENYTMNFISDGCTRITGYTPDDFVIFSIISFNELILPEYRDKIRQKWHKVIDENQVFEEEYPIKTASGEIKWIWERGGGVFSENGELLFLEGYIEDITTNKLAEEKLRQSEANLARTIENSPFGIRILTNNGTTLYSNPTLLRIFGFKSLNDFNQIPVSSWYTPESYSGYLNRETRRNNNEEVENEYEITIVSKESGIKHLLVHRQKMLWNGELNNQVTYQDITEKNRAESELIRSKEKAEESDRLKSAFLANISHEIRTPMNGILGFADLLRTPDLTTENQQEFIEVIEKCGQRMLNVINDLIDISIIESGEIKLKHTEIHLNKLLEELLRFFKPQFGSKNLVLNSYCGLSDDACIVRTDGGKLHQIFTNLIRNGLKFTETGQVDFGYQETDTGLAFFVKDTGIGIPEEQQELIFERFRQGSISLNRKYEGSGLGLTISKAYIELLGGRIWVESVFRKGTTFWFEIPLKSSQNTENESGLTNYTEKNSFDIHILVAEDDVYSRIFIKEILEKSVALLWFATNGEEAVRMVKENPKISMVLMDLKMPVMDGFEATRRIKKLRPEIPVIAQTAFAFGEDKEKAMAAGCTDFITKPVNRKNLMDVISKNILVVLLLLMAACSSHPGSVESTSFRPSTIQVEGLIIHTDSLPSPEIIPAGKPKQVRIGKTSEIPEHPIIRPLIDPIRKLVLKPNRCVMGENGFEFPKPVKAILNPVFCKAPEVVLVKDAYAKDINPQNFISFSKLQGLRHDQIRSLIQDKMGNIWLGTDDGVTKYDGKYFSHYTIEQGLNNNLILSVFQDKSGNLWFGTFGGGVTKYDGRYLTNLTISEGLPSNIVNCISEDNAGNLWFGTGTGAVKFDGTSFTSFTQKEGLCHNDVRSIVRDDSGKIWISTNGGGISVFDGQSFSNYSEKEGLLQNYIGSLYKTKDGSIWIGSVTQGLMKFDGSTFTVYSKKEGLPNYAIRTILEDTEGNMWFGSSNDGVSKFDGKYFTHYTENEGLNTNIFRSSLSDQTGNLWFGTRGGGLIRFDGNLFTHLSANEGLSHNRIMSILQDKTGNLWFGTFGGYVTKCSTRIVNGIKQQYFTRFGEKEGLLNSRIYSIIQDKDGNIWFGTDGGGVSKFDGETMTTYTHLEGLKNNSIRKIYQDRDGIYWFATYGSGVSRFDGKTFTNYTKKDGLGSDNVLSILQDTNGTIWFGTDNGGVTCYDGKNFIQYSKKQGFFNNTVYSILQDKDGLMWFGTGGDGVISFDGKIFTRYADDAGLNNNHILSLLQDSHNNIWVGTRFGPNVLKAGNRNRITRETSSTLFKSYGYEDGFLGIGCNLGAIAEDRDGNIWIGTNDRLTTFHAGKEKTDSIPPNLQLTKIQLFHEDIPWTELAVKKDTTMVLRNGIALGKLKFTGISQWYGLPENLSLPFNHNYLSFDFIGITQTQIKKIKYQYQLEGLDKDWSTSTDRTEVTYGNLHYGNYIFRVKSINSEGFRSNEISYPFSIRPPWWSTWWFYLFLLVAFILMIYSFIKYRIRKLKHDKQLLLIKVNEQTHELTEKNEALIQQKNQILEKNISIGKKNEELQLINSEKDKFFSIIAHDVRGPLSAFMGLSEILSENIQGMTDAELQKIASVMYVSSQNLYDLLENLLEWSKIERGMMIFSPQSANLLTITREIIALTVEIAKNKKIDLSIDIPAELNVYADKNMLASIIRNLVSNAIKFTPVGGKTSLLARPAEENEIEIRVTDTGIGIPAEMIENLFLLNGLTSRKGTEGEPSTGLGLLLCKEFIEKHGSFIRVESEVGKGSTFSFILKSQAEPELI